MNLKYKLRENDYLQMQLYFFKANNTLRKIVINNLMTWLVIFLVIILILYSNNQKFGALLLSIGAFLSLIIKPFGIKEVYFQRLKKESKKFYESEFNKLISVDFLDDSIYIDRIEKQTTIAIAEIEKVIETKQHYFIKFKIDVLLLPKSEIENQDLVKSELLNLTKKLNIELENQLNWKW